MIESLSVGGAVSLLFVSVLCMYTLLLIVQHFRSVRQLDSLHLHEMDVLRSHFVKLQDERDYAKKQREGAWSGFRKFVVRAKELESEDICSFYFEPHDGRELPSFKPGQYLTFNLHIPEQAKPVIRCYSLSDSIYHPDYYRCSIKRMLPPPNNPDAPSGLSSSFFHEQIKVGDILDIRAPAGQFYLNMMQNSPVVLIGGGVGLTPVLSMLNSLVESQEKNPAMLKREIWFFYGMNHGGEHAFKEHLERLAAENDNVNLIICYSSPNDEDVQGKDYQYESWVGVDLFKKLLPSNNYDFYTCGPPAMMKSINDGLKEWGVPDDNIHYEAFGPPPKPPKPPKPSVNNIEILFSKSDKRVAWSEADGSILDLAENNGINIDFSCRAGNCGSCETALRSGSVDYFSEPGALIKEGSCLVCVSTPKESITIDA